MRVHTAVLLTIVTVLAAAACGERESDPAAPAAAPAAGTTGSPNAPATVTSPAGAAPADQQAPTLATAEARYLIEALQHGMGQIELAQSVSRRSASDAVDALAREIIAANNDINAALTRTAFKHSVTLPNDAAPALRQIIARLEHFEGRNLDAAWLGEVLQTYPDLIDLHASATTTATDVDVRNIATRARALFVTNLGQARQAYAQVTGVVAPQVPDPGALPPASGGTTGTGGR